jgi:hypothetical protein
MSAVSSGILGIALGWFVGWIRGFVDRRSGMEIKADHQLMTAEEINEVIGHLRSYAISRIGSVTEARIRVLIPRLEHHAEALAFSESMKVLATEQVAVAAMVREDS